LVENSGQTARALHCFRPKKAAAQPKEIGSEEFGLLNEGVGESERESSKSGLAF